MGRNQKRGWFQLDEGFSDMRTHTFGRGQWRNWRAHLVFLNYVRSSASDKAAGMRMIIEWKFGILRGMEEGFDNGRKGLRSSTARQMIATWAVGEGYSCFGCRLVWMTAMVFSIFEKMRLAGSAICNGDILLLGFFSFFKLWNRLHLYKSTSRFTILTFLLHIYVFLFFLNVKDITKALPPLFHFFPFFPFEK